VRTRSCAHDSFALFAITPHFLLYFSQTSDPSTTGSISENLADPSPQTGAANLGFHYNELRASVAPDPRSSLDFDLIFWAFKAIEV
jgi:hypothetical protein